MRLRKLVALRLGVLGAALALPFAPLVANAAGGDPAAAEALFAAGREAMERGDYAAACAKFDESERLDPAPGTLMNLADCNEKRGHLAAAWENWRDARGTLRPDDDRLRVVEARLATLEARLPHLVIELAPGAPAASHSAKVRRTGSSSSTIRMVSVITVP